MEKRWQAIRAGALVATLLAAGSRALAQDPTPSEDAKRQAEIDDLRARLDELERKYVRAEPGEVDLSGREVAPATIVADENPLARPWYQNVDVSGYAAFTYLDTGSVGLHPDGAFLVQDASLFLDVRVWERTLLHAELQAASVGYDFLATGELYADLQRIWSGDSGSFATLRAGRFWVPFGEETYWFRAPENPLISYSAAFPWGLDEGVELFGSIHGVDWVASLTTGNAQRNSEDGPGKTVNLKASGKPLDALQLSGSLMFQGETSTSALAFGGTSIDPVGSNGSSSAGASPSGTVSATLEEADATIRGPARTSLGLTYGHASVDDDVDAFDRTFHWFRIEPRYDFTPDLFGVLRYSEVGTYDSSEGYHFDGLMIADGNTAFGYDVQRFRRIAGGLGWRANPHTLVKVEVGHDKFWVIDGSPTQPGQGDRTYFGASLVVSF
jgi:hypothetical protein